MIIFPNSWFRFDEFIKLVAIELPNLPKEVLIDAFVPCSHTLVGFPRHGAHGVSHLLLFLAELVFDVGLELDGLLVELLLGQLALFGHQGLVHYESF